MTSPTTGWVLWAGTVGFDGPLDERLEAAAAAGYERVSLSPVDIERSDPAWLRTAAAEVGIRWIVDPVVGWLPASASSRSPLAAYSTDDALDMAEAVDAVSVSAVALTSVAHPPGELVERFALLCDGAADRGLDVHLEFIPMTVVADITIAWAIVAAAARDNGGLVVDTWHFFRGTPDFDTLAAIPGDRVFCVQISDAPATPTMPLWDDTFHRLMPGDGDFDIARVLGTLSSSGGLTWIGPEIFRDGAGDAVTAARMAKSRIEAI